MENKKFKKILSILFFSLTLNNAYAGEFNIAPIAKVTASNYLNDTFSPSKINDGLIMYENQGEWACKGYVTPWGEMYLPWIQLNWEDSVIIDRVVIYDRVSASEHIAGGNLHFSDGSKIGVTQISNDGSPKSVRFPAKKVSWVRFEATDGNGKNIGLSEIEVFKAKNSNSDYVEWVDPYIETTRGRWFYCTPAARPLGMVAAHAYTRNKNQGGGGYNYNFPDILGFTQINDWMISGLNIMPINGTINPLKGEEEWKSPFKHESEIIQPGYHRLYLDKYKVWVEYSSTDRAAIYRLNYTQNNDAKLLVDVGSVLGNCSMDKATIKKVNDNRIEGEFSTTNRFWGGPDTIPIFFVLESNKPFRNMDGWNENGIEVNVKSISGDDAGVILDLDMGSEKEVIIKMGLSYTSIKNAINNLNLELNHWNFDCVKDESYAIWNEMLGRIAVDGGNYAQKTKFYTDLWHVLLGRHKINDIDGWYPDYTSGKYVDKRTSEGMKLRRTALNKDKTSKFNMYGFDALWLTQWNLNVLWGLAWPELLDDFSACLIEYADNGGLLPRGACAGGYSFIMTGCPASSMLISTYMKGIMKKNNPKHVYNTIKRNHMSGGMMSYENSDDLEFYIKNGWCPNNAGKTIEWAFQDWGLSRMAKHLGKSSDEKEFERRSKGWRNLYNKEQGLIFSKTQDGDWLHLEPLNGKGWIEANSWQGTWSVSHDLPYLVEIMGGNDKFCEKLNYAFEKSRDLDFVYSYSGGYVSYANQPGCSNAHLFTYGGKPWMTQYWVRQVKEKAYGSIEPDKGYGGHDEDQGQMGAVSALMAIGLFSVTGTESDNPYYEITSPIFDKVEIKLNNKYYAGDKFIIETHNNSNENCYIEKAELNGKNWDYVQFDHGVFEKGGKLELWLQNQPNKEWGKLKYFDNIK